MEKLILILINSHLALKFSKLIDLAFEGGVYHSCLKLAKVLSIFKSSSKTFPGKTNYICRVVITSIGSLKRLFSLSDFFGKIIIFNSSQFDFREEYSTTLALSEFVESTLTSFDKGNAVCAVLLDKSKAFDYVDKINLLDQLKYYGIRRKSLKFQ